MFDAKTYIARRKKLKAEFDNGLLIFPGNNESPMNFPENFYHYRQDSTFLYFWGLNLPGLAAVIDLEDDREIIFGDDFSIDHIIWMGPQPRIAEQAAQAGISVTRPLPEFTSLIKDAERKGRAIHFLPQYRHENMIWLSELLSLSPQVLNENHSVELAKAVIKQRSIKSENEVAEMETALAITYDMQTYAMRHTRPGIVEREIAGGLEGIALKQGAGLAYPVIFSIHGETLHNHNYSNVMQTGDIALNDSGAAAVSNYAGDITRTLPVSGKFSVQQKEIYQLVLDTMESGIRQMKPGLPFRDVHLHCSTIILEGLKSLGLVKGDIDEARSDGVQGLFFPHGIGHMLGLDVHDMEDLGEELVGYDDTIKRSSQFGLRSLRMAKPLQPGHVVTVEPGIYFIPQLIDLWQTDQKHTDFVNYDALRAYRNFGGIRIEENVLVTDDGHRILGRPIPKTIPDVEAMCG